MSGLSWWCLSSWWLDLDLLIGFSYGGFFRLMFRGELTGFRLELGYELGLTRVSLAEFGLGIWGYGPPFIQLSLPTV